MSASDVVLEIRDVVVELRRQQVLAGVDLVVGAGEIVGLVGGNGSGKSTMLRVATGLIRPQQGSVRLFGVAPTSPDALRRVGAVIDTPLMYPWMSGRGVLKTLINLSGRPDRGEVRQALERFRLDRVGRKPAVRYSQGMRKRLALAGASLLSPELLVLDEPTNALDPDGRRIALEWIGQHRDGGGSAVIATHRQDDVLLCDRAYRLADGRTVEVDPSTCAAELAVAL